MFCAAKVKPTLWTEQRMTKAIKECTVWCSKSFDNYAKTCHDPPSIFVKPYREVKETHVGKLWGDRNTCSVPTKYCVGFPGCSAIVLIPNNMFDIIILLPLTRKQWKMSSKVSPSWRGLLISSSTAEARNGLNWIWLRALARTKVWVVWELHIDFNNFWDDWKGHRWGFQGRRVFEEVMMIGSNLPDPIVSPGLTEISYIIY